MADDIWSTVERLQSEGALLVEDGNHGEYRPRREEFAAQGVAFVRAADIDQGRVDFAQCERINDLARARIRKGIGQPLDILLSHKGTVGKLAVVGEDAPPFVCSPQTTFWRVLDTDRIDRRYLYAFMSSQAFTSQLRSVQGETDMAPYVSLTAQRRLRVPLPSLRQQNAVGSVLGALDAKIQLNLRTNETLEGVARALFKSWFADFDHNDSAPHSPMPGSVSPVGGSAGRQSWERGRLDSVLQLHYGKSLSAEVRKPGAVPVYGSGGVTGRHNAALVEGPGIIVGRKGTVGSLYWEDRPFFPIDTVFYVRSSMPLIYCYYLLQTLGLEQMNTDAAVPGLNRENAYRLMVPIPPSEMVAAFDDVAKPLRQRILVNLDQARTLAGLREILLPKLLSGAVQVKDAEQRLAETL